MVSTLVNGRPARSVPAGDRGLMYGDGVFRTLRVKAGRVLNEARQFRLLAHDCGVIGLPCPEPSLLLEEIGRLAPGDAIVKVIVTRGVAGRGYAVPATVKPLRVVAAYPAPTMEESAARDGIRVRRCNLALAPQPRLAGVKSLNRLENVLARAEWHDPAIREGLLTDPEDRLIEATMSNVFFTIDGVLVTPELSRCGVNGAQRERVLELARAEAIACEVRDAPYAQLREAGEVFLTGSVIGLWPVVALEDLQWKPGPVARRLQGLIDEEDSRRT